MSSDRIVLTVPARSDYARTVRMTAAELAARIGMSYDEVEDVRMAAEEAFVYAGDCLGDEEEVVFTFLLDEDSLTVEVGPFVVCDTPGQDASEGYAEFILQSVCDEFSIAEADGMQTLRLRRAIAPGESLG